MSSRRGQLFSFDGFLAVVVMLSFLSMYFLLFNTNVFSLVDQVRGREMELRIESLIGSLVRTSGDPSDWMDRDTDAISHVGLARGQNTVSVERVIALKNLTTNDLRRVTRFPFPFRLDVLDINGTTVEHEGSVLEVGEPLPTSGPELVVVRSPVLLVSDGGHLGHGLVRIVVWRQ